MELDALLSSDTSLAEMVDQEKQQSDQELRDIEVQRCIMYGETFLCKK